MMLRNLRLLVAAAISSALAAQTLQMTEGNLRVATGAPSATSHNPVSLALRADATNINHAFEHWWYYRIAGDTREFSLRAIGPVSGGVPSFLTHADRDFADVDGRGLLRANVDMDIYATGSASGVFTSRLTMTNLSAAPLTLDLFAYTDLDIAGTASNDVVTGDGQRHFVTDWTGVQIEVRGIDADRSTVGAYPTVRNLLTNTTVDDLPNNLPPFSGDYTGAFQWTSKTLFPGEQRSFNVVFAIDNAATRVPIVEHYGAGSTLAAEIYTDTLPLQDNANLRQLGIHLKGAPPNAPVGLLSNTTSVAGLPFLGFTLWVDPNPPMQFPIGFTNPQGQTSFVFTIPPSPYLTGYPIYHQYFFADSNSANGVGQSTPALMTTVGRL